jgi:ribosomal protein L44E
MICDDDLDNCNTLGELIALRHTVTAVCTHCNRHTVLDLESLQEKHGADMKIRRVALKLKCEGCGRRDGEIRVTPHTAYS